MSDHLLEVDDLYVEFRTRDGVAKAINGVSYTLDAGETLAVLGESGSGKSVTAQTIMGILDMPPGFITGGAIRYKGNDLLKMPEKDRRKIRGAEISMIFQDSLSALNPVFTVGDQISEMFQVHRGMSKKEGMARAVELMDQVRIPAAKERVKDYPHQFSGGMRQRIMIAMAISLDPAVLIADEPTTALDVTVQAQIMELLQDLQRERNMGMILITHDLGVVANMAHRVLVMYAGRAVETSDAADLYAHPRHPYTAGLLGSIPSLEGGEGRLTPIRGTPPSLINIPAGCPFSPRCPLVDEVCRTEPDLLATDRANHTSACHHWQPVADAPDPRSFYRAQEA